MCLDLQHLCLVVFGSSLRLFARAANCVPRQRRRNTSFTRHPSWLSYRTEQKLSTSGFPSSLFFNGRKMPPHSSPSPTPLQKKRGINGGNDRKRKAVTYLQSCSVNRRTTMTPKTRKVRVLPTAVRVRFVRTRCK